MYDNDIKLNTAKLAAEKGFPQDAAPCTCGGFPDCICDQVRALVKRESPERAYYRAPQHVVQAWLREFGVEAYALPVFTISDDSKFAYAYSVETAQSVKGNSSDLRFDTYYKALEAALVHALTNISPAKNESAAVETTINMSRYKPNDGKTFSGRVFAGQEFGALVRAESGIDRLARIGADIVLQFPDDTFTVNPSFLVGLLPGVYAIIGGDAAHARFHGRVRFDIPSAFDIRDNLELALDRLARL